MYKESIVYNQEAAKHLSSAAIKNIEIWQTDQKYKEFWPSIDKLIKDENWSELEDSFFKILEFGTAGRRGKVGAGCNRINTITIGESVQALANYLRQVVLETSHSVVIAYDTRNSSLELARLAASVLAENNIQALLFSQYRSTPELSFAVRHLKTSAGIVISASHNPPQDNGIKIYWSDGAQISAPHDKNLMVLATEVSEFRAGNFEDNLRLGKIQLIDHQVDDAYIETNAKLSLLDNHQINIVYSPLHGTGTTNFLKTIIRAGFNNISLVESQMVADGNFPTIIDHKPNPENLNANELAIEQLLSTKYDVAFTTDPDADRICAMSLEKNGEVKSFTGNETAILVADYILKQKSERGQLDGRQYVVKTAVTTDALNALAQKYQVPIFDNMLVGFKYIGKTIERESQLNKEFIAGFEESLGQLVGSQTRDKDAATGGLMIAELAADLKVQGKTLGEKLNEIYQEIGHFYEKTLALEFPGADGFDKMAQTMASARSGQLDFSQTAVLDYLSLVKTDVENNAISSIDCIGAGNVVVFEFEHDHRKRITIRPSGTEPKLKIYIQWFAGSDDNFENKLEEILNNFKERILN